LRDRSIAECRRHTSAWPTLAATTRRGFPWRSTAVGSAPGGRRCGGTDRMVSDQGPWHPTAWGGVGNYTLSPPLNFNGARWGDGGSSCILFGRVWGTTGGTHKAYLWQPDPGGGGVPSNGSGLTPLQPCLGPRTPLRHCPGPLSNSPLSTAPTFRPPSSAPLPWAISKPRNSSPNCSQTTKLPTSIRGPDSRRRVASSRWRRWIAHIKGLGQAPVY